MFSPKFRFTHDKVRIIVFALIELKNQLLDEGRYTDAVDELLEKLLRQFAVVTYTLNTYPAQSRAGFFIWR